MRTLLARMMRVAVISGAAGALPIAAASPVSAAWLSGRTCTQLEDEQRGLIAAGAQADFAQGPAVVGALSIERRERLVRLLEVRAMLEFQCTSNPRLRPPHLAALPVRRPADIEAIVARVAAAKARAKQERRAAKLRRLDRVAMHLAAAG